MLLAVKYSKAITTMNICIFCGANTGNSPAIIEAVEALMDLLIAQEANLVYGGGKSGLMGLIADQFLAAGQPVIGVRPEKLIQDEDAHTGITQMFVVKDMFERKAKMMELADVFIALPGGAGTLDEIIEVYTQVKIGFADKLCTVLNTNNFYEGLQILFDKMVETGYLKANDQSILYFHDTPDTLAKQISSYPGM